MRKLVGNRSPFFNAEVKAVDGSVCTILLPSGLEIEGVRLTAGASENHYILEPKKGSKVLVADLTGQLKSLAVIQVEEVAAVRIKQGPLEVLIDSEDNKVQIKNAAVSLVDVFQGIVDILFAFAVTTPNGPSGTALPTSVAQINTWKTQFNQLLKRT